MVEQEIQYIQEKVLYYGWITEELWNENVPLYNPNQNPDFLQWLIQRKLIREEQAQLMRPGLESLKRAAGASQGNAVPNLVVDVAPTPQSTPIPMSQESFQDSGQQEPQSTPIPKTPSQVVVQAPQVIVQTPQVIAQPPPVTQAPQQVIAQPSQNETPTIMEPSPPKNGEQVIGTPITQHNNGMVSNSSQTMAPTTASDNNSTTSTNDAETIVGQPVQDNCTETLVGEPEQGEGQQTLSVDFSQENTPTESAPAASNAQTQQTMNVDFSQEAPRSKTPTYQSNSASVGGGFDPSQKKMGHYDIIEKLGEGGMGQVYKAKHTFLDKVVALKVLAKHLSSNQQFIERFFREAKASGKMEHPNVVRSLDAGEIEGVCFLALEYVEGKPLSDLVKEGSVNQPKAIKYLIGILKALDYAEGLRLVHRDIKPDNIMITKKGVSKLLDMGLTKEVGDTSMTKAGQILGTPDYISPEQARGDLNIDIRSDIYSLGATFYHVLTGQRPFRGGDSIITLLNQHISAPLTPLQQIKPHLDKDLCAIIEKMMAKDKFDRFEHPKDIIKEIENLIKQSKAPPASVPAAPPAEVQLAVETTSQNPAPAQSINPYAATRNPNAPQRTAAPDVIEPLLAPEATIELEMEEDIAKEELAKSAKKKPINPYRDEPEAAPRNKNIPSYTSAPAKKETNTILIVLMVLGMAVLIGVVITFFVMMNKG